MIERELLGDHASHGMTCNMGRIPFQMIHEAFRIFCHCLDCDRATARHTPSNATIIKDERLVVAREAVDLRLPGATHNSDALDQQHWRASSRQSVMKPNISAVQKFAVIHLQILILNE